MQTSDNESWIISSNELEIRETKDCEINLWGALRLHGNPISRYVTPKLRFPCTADSSPKLFFVAFAPYNEHK